MKKISQQQLEAILEAMMKCNIPVQVYAGMQDLFTKLEVIKEEDK